MALDIQPLLMCPECRAAYLGDEAKRAVCRCGHNLSEGCHLVQALEMSDMYGTRRARITADEEERMRLGYQVSSHYEPRSDLRVYLVRADGSDRFSLSYDHRGRVITANTGARQAKAQGEPTGFALCGKCHQWLLSTKAMQEHVDPNGRRRCSRHATAADLVHGLHLYTEILTDVLTLDVPLTDQIDPGEADPFYTTLLHTCLRSICVTLDLAQSEIGGFLAPNPNHDERRRVILFETEEGGAGALESLIGGPRLGQVMKRARELLHDNEPDEGCERACYECLLSFCNQRDHELLDRQLVLPFLHGLEGLTVAETQPTSDDFDALLSACQSDLERHVLREIRDRGLRLPDASQRTLYDGDAPIAVADFFYDPNIVVFVDGSPHHLDYVAASDHTKRQRLKARGYRILIVKGEQVEDALNRLAAWLS